RRHYVAAVFKIELFHLFLQRGTSLLAASGCLGFIVPTTLLNNVYAEKLRQWLMGRCAIKTIAISPIHVFAEADVHTSVVILTRETNAKNRAENLIATTTDLTSEFAASPGDYASTLQSRFTALPGCVWNVLLNEANGGLIEKIRRAGQPLEAVAKINRGLITGNRKQFFSVKKLTEKHVSILTGADVKRYSTKDPNEFVLFERPESAGGCWDKDVHLAPHKVVVRQIGTKPTASFIAKPIAVTGNIFTIRGKSEEHEKLILGIVNSTLIEFFWGIMFSDFKSTFPQVTIFSLAQVPVSDAPTGSNGFDSTQRTVIRLVDEILAVKRTDAEADTSAMEREIDQQVYALYGLTPEEIAIVEGTAK
ncbi:MAG: TaqI-like C-terminal specificity domain-containing protein, partial [Verrucomicrobiota bacterium]